MLWLKGSLFTILLFSASVARAQEIFLRCVNDRGSVRDISIVADDLLVFSAEDGKYVNIAGSGYSVDEQECTSSEKEYFCKSREFSFGFEGNNPVLLKTDEFTLNRFTGSLTRLIRKINSNDVSPISVSVSECTAGTNMANTVKRRF